VLSVENQNVVLNFPTARLYPRQVKLEFLAVEVGLHYFLNTYINVKSECPSQASSNRRE
jgi:hypothetical protein